MSKIGNRDTINRRTCFRDFSSQRVQRTSKRARYIELNFRAEVHRGSIGRKISLTFRFGSFNNIRSTSIFPSLQAYTIVFFFLELGLMDDREIQLHN